MIRVMKGVFVPQSDEHASCGLRISFSFWLPHYTLGGLPYPTRRARIELVLRHHSSGYIATRRGIFGKRARINRRTHS